jgi:hypothetical protein
MEMEDESLLTNLPPLRPFEVNEILVLDDRLEARFVNYKAGLRSWAMVYVTNAVQPHLADVRVTRLKRREVSTPVTESRRPTSARELPDVFQEDFDFLESAMAQTFRLVPEMMGTADRNPLPERLPFRVNIEGLQAAGIDVEQLRAPPEEEKVEVVVVTEFSRKVEL